MASHSASVKWKVIFEDTNGSGTSSWAMLLLLYEKERIFTNTMKTYRIALNFRGSLISRIFNRSQKYFDKIFFDTWRAVCAWQYARAANPRNYFNEFFKNRYSWKFRPSKFYRYTVCCTVGHLPWEISQEYFFFAENGRSSSSQNNWTTSAKRLTTGRAQGSRRVGSWAPWLTSTFSQVFFQYVIQSLHSNVSHSNLASY